MNGELPTLVKEENGKEITYIVLNPSGEDKTVQPDKQYVSDEIDYKKEYEELHKEFLILKTKYEKLLAAQSS
jgi:hypothetical protein